MVQDSFHHCIKTKKMVENGTVVLCVSDGLKCPSWMLRRNNFSMVLFTFFLSFPQNLGASWFSRLSWKSWPSGGYKTKVAVETHSRFYFRRNNRLLFCILSEPQGIPGGDGPAGPPGIPGCNGTKVNCFKQVYFEALFKDSWIKDIFSSSIREKEVLLAHLVYMAYLGTS